MQAAYDIEISLRSLRDISVNGKKRRNMAADGPVDVLLCVVDHFEPQVGGAAAGIADRRLKNWLDQYPKIADRHRDADDCRPAHSFFYPWDEYRVEEMAPLQAMCAEGYGEIEVHLHHRDDTEATLRAKLEDAIAEFRSHGALACWPTGKPAFGFIHGNWALDNSRQENGANFCGVNSEIRLLRDLGCYADFTFPAWQKTAQPRLTNAIYYATDDPEAPKSHERGPRARVGASDRGDLLLVQGALVPYLLDWKRGGRPAMDDSDLAFYRRYEPTRADRWIGAGIHVEGCGSRVFVKLHCHGAADKNSECLLGSDLDRMFSDLEARYNDGTRYRLHYVTAREMFNVIRATEIDASLLVGAARNYLLKPPAQTVSLKADRLVQPIAEGGEPAARCA
jgi:hypothetical protein